MKKNGFLPLVSGFLLFGILFMFTEEFSRGFADGLMKCGNIVIPSMFPFLVSSSLAGSGHIPKVIKRIFEPITQKIFRLPAECLPAMIISQLGGYLSGAKSADSLYKAEIISSSQASRLLFFSINPGMGFAVNAVGSIMLSSRQSGRILLFSLCVSSLITALLTRFMPESKTSFRPSQKIVPFSSALVSSVNSGTNAMLAACGFICLFSGILSVCRKLVTDTAAFSVVSCLLEITNGCFYASGQFSLPVIAVFCGFGGLCVHLQIFAVADFRIDIFNFYLFRIIHSVLSFFICKTVLHFFPVESSVFLSVSENIALWSFSPLSAISLLFLSLLLIFDLDNNRKICYHSTVKELN